MPRPLLDKQGLSCALCSASSRRAWPKAGQSGKRTHGLLSGHTFPSWRSAQVRSGAKLISTCKRT